jgi:hypothetical protein
MKEEYFPSGMMIFGMTRSFHFLVLIYFIEIWGGWSALD